MAPKIEDRWLWLGLGVFTFIAVKGVSHGLRHIVHLTEVHNPAPRPPLTSPLTHEDAIKTSSLQTLATSENIEISKAATKIFCDRFMAHPSALKLIYKDLKSADEDVQHRALRALGLLNDFVAGVPAATATAQRRHGGGVDDPEERELRRRRREAMVLNEGDHPVGQEDVWMRDGEGRMSSEELTRPVGALEELMREQIEDEDSDEDEE